MPAVGRSARLLGFAGLIPQIAVVGVIAFADRQRGFVPAAVDLAAVVGIAYPLSILCFIGGMWWGLAMRRSDDGGGGQGRLALVAVVPSLLALALPLIIGLHGMAWAMVAIGSVIMLTLPVDRRIVASGDAPTGWMELRIPLSVGLGGLTILAGTLLGR